MSFLSTLANRASSLVGRAAGMFGVEPSTVGLSATYAVSAPPYDADHLGDLPAWAQQHWLGGNLTPVDVGAIVREADCGNCRRLVELADDFREKDGHLQCVLRASEQMVALLPWSVSAYREKGANGKPRKHPRQKDAKAAQFVERALGGATGDGTNVRSFGDLIDHLQGANYHGFAVAQTVWHYDGRWILPRGFILNDQRRFCFDTYGKLVWQDVNQFGSTSGVNLHETYPGSFIIHQPRTNGDIPQREGLSRPLVRLALLRNWALKSYMQLAERGWKPNVFAKYDVGSTDENLLGRLRSALRVFQSSGILAYPNTAEVEIDRGGSGGGNSGHKELLEYLGKEMSKAVLHQTLTTEVGSNGVRGAAEVQADEKLNVREVRARQTASTIMRDLVWWIVALNFGPGLNLPVFAFDTSETSDLAQVAQAAARFAKGKIPVTLEFIHDRIGHGALEKGDLLIDGSVWGADEESESKPENDPPSDDEPDATEDDGEEPDDSNDDSDEQDEAA